MAMELYITTGKMLGTDLLSEFLEDKYQDLKE